MPFSPLDRSPKLKSGKDINYTTNKLDLTEIYRIFHITDRYYRFSVVIELSLKSIMTDYEDSLYECKAIKNNSFYLSMQW